MDLATIIGLAAGALMVLGTILMGGSLAIFIHIPSIMVVFGGAISAALISFKLSEIIGVMGVVRKAFFEDKVDIAGIIAGMVELAEKSRKEGLLALDRELQAITDPFLKSGLEMVVDGNEPATVRSSLETELAYLTERHKIGQRIFTALGMYAPAFGMIGTLIGLIAMLQSLDDPSSIGGGMAVALITTFYGALGANLIFLPLSGKLKNRSDSEVVLKEMVIEGVLAIQNGEHPKNIQRKLFNFIAPRERKADSDK